MALNDSAVLGAHLPFQGRVQASMVSGCVVVSAEGINVNNHTQRLQLVHTILANPTNLQNYTTMFAMAVAVDPTVLSDATSASTIQLDGSNVATRAVLVTDAHINAALVSSVNAFCQGILA